MTSSYFHSFRSTSSSNVNNQMTQSLYSRRSSERDQPDFNHSVSVVNNSNRTTKRATSAHGLNQSGEGKCRWDGTLIFLFQLDFDVVGFFFRSQPFVSIFFCLTSSLLIFVLSAMVDFKKLFYFGIIRLVSPVCELLQLHLTFYYQTSFKRRKGCSVWSFY